MKMDGPLSEPCVGDELNGCSRSYK